MRERSNTEPFDMGSQRSHTDLGRARRASHTEAAVTQRTRLNSMGSALASASSPFRIRSTSSFSRKSSMLSWQDDDLGLRRGESNQSIRGLIKEEFSDQSDISDSVSEGKNDDKVTAGDDEVPQEGPRVSLSENNTQAWLCCQFPGACLFSIIILQCVAAVFSHKAFLMCTTVLTIYIYCWATNLAVFSAVGAWRMRRDCAQDWHSLLVRAQEDAPGRSEVMHIVIIPNYKEEEDMLAETLENIGQSPSAVGTIRIVLGMESREGPEGKEKAERLIAKTKHLFADIFATYHPPGIPGELAGKSSNTQWAYRATLKRYRRDLEGFDATKVFLSVGDADTLWNPQYFDALAVQALTMPSEQVAWTIWQPPMLLFRNLFAVPGVTRLSGMGTLLFELAGLANQHIGSHFCFSSYSLSLALAQHREVRGWDTDVVAEDHHMFVKCFFAPLWAASEEKNALTIEPKVELRPIYLPAEGYLVESSEGYLASCWARFQQARRHSQGVAELGYMLQQYLRLSSACGGPSKLSIRTHRQILAIMWKMYCVHIINAVQAFSMIVAGAFAVVGVLGGLWAEGFGAVLAQGGYHFAAGSFSTFAFAKWALFVTFGPAPAIALISGSTIYLVVRDVIEGRYTFKTEFEDDPKEKLTTRQRFELAVGLQRDMLVFAEPTVVAFGLVPVTMACWSLFRNGMRFEYIVAAKPGDTQ